MSKIMKKEFTENFIAVHLNIIVIENNSKKMNLIQNSGDYFKTFIHIIIYT